MSLQVGGRGVKEHTFGTSNRFRTFRAVLIKPQLRGAGVPPVETTGI